jgi:hypothetical protein
MQPAYNDSEYAFEVVNRFFNAQRWSDSDIGQLRSTLGSIDQGPLSYTVLDLGRAPANAFVGRWIGGDSWNCLPGSGFCTREYRMKERFNNSFDKSIYE